jgi:hypothetical protein
MTQALAAIAIILAGAILGSTFKPSEEQSRPLVPEKPAGGEAPGGHGRHH